MNTYFPPSTLDNCFELERWWHINSDYDTVKAIYIKPETGEEIEKHTTLEH